MPLSYRMNGWVYTCTPSHAAVMLTAHKTTLHRLCAYLHAVDLRGAAAVGAGTEELVLVTDGASELLWRFGGAQDWRQLLEQVFVAEAALASAPRPLLHARVLEAVERR